MSFAARIAPRECRRTVVRAYREGRARAEADQGAESPHWVGLCDALSSHCFARHRLLPRPALWAELAPFLLAPDDTRGLELLAEYAVYNTCPAAASIERLGVEVNGALHRLDIADWRMVTFLDDAMTIYRPAWLALLSYETLRWVQRALDASGRLECNRRTEWSGRGGPLWLKRGPGEVESEALGSLQS